MNPCAGNNRQAKDPRTGALLGPGSLAHRLGHPRLGRLRQRHDPGRQRHRQGRLHVARGSSAPRFGAAYDVTGQQKFVFRGSVGLYFDRPDGNTVFSTVGNPPVATSLTQQWGHLQTCEQPVPFGPVPTISSTSTTRRFRRTSSGTSACRSRCRGRRRSTSRTSAITRSTSSPQAVPARRNFNTIDLGTTLTRGTGSDAGHGHGAQQQPAAPFRGYGNINMQMPLYRTSTRCRRPGTAASATGSRSSSTTTGRSPTWATSLPGPQLRLIHSADGTYSESPDQAIAEEMFADQGTSTHIINGNFT